ncbi:MAG: DUF262 domain-containing protein [Anaerolineae bacterium]|nr:DUF262 domain-containing protein [Anaerolineae bacterium]
MEKESFELMTLNDIFDSGNRQLCVPDYQRGYSWEEEQRNDLIGDIEQIQHQQHRHFMGTIVASRQGDSNRFDIVDGQQRITSLVLLLASIVRLVRHNPLVDLTGVAIDDVEACYICSGVASGNTRYRLKLGTNRDPLFQEVLKHGCVAHQKIQNKADQNIVDAALQFDTWLQDMSEGELSKVLSTVTNRLGFLLYAPKQDAEIGLMFEVINNRGKPLSELEKIKNYLIYFAGRHQTDDLKNKVNNSWPLLLQALNTAGYTSNDDEDRFLRVCWIVFQDYNKSRSYHVYDNLKQAYPPDDPANWRMLSQFVDFVVTCAQTYASLYQPGNSTLSDDEKIYLQRISLHPANASILPLVVSLFAVEHDALKRAELLDLLEKLNFRYYVTGIANRNDSGQGELFELAHNYYNDTFEIDVSEENLDNYELLCKRLTEFISNNANDHKVVQYLTLDADESGDYYRWQGLKFFLGSYEDALRSENRQGSRLPDFLASRDKVNPNDFYHLEHIWATKDYTVVKDEGDKDVNKRRLGNFILLMEVLNIKVSDHRPEIKVDEYFEGTKSQPNTLMIRELLGDFKEASKYMDKHGGYTRKVANYWYSLYQYFLDLREKRMINFALNRWRVEGIVRPIESVAIDSFLDSNEIFRCFPEYKEKAPLVAE